MRQAGQALGLRHGVGVVLRGVVVGLRGVVPENPAFFQSRLDPVALWAKRLKIIAGESMGADSCPRENVVNVRRCRYAPVNEAGGAKRVSR